MRVKNFDPWFSRLDRGLIWKKEATGLDRELEGMVETVKEKRKAKLALMHQWQLAVEEEKSKVESLQAEDKLAEKQFKLDFEKEFEGAGAVIVEGD